jgi:hypothetical protein
VTSPLNLLICNFQNSTYHYSRHHIDHGSIAYQKVDYNISGQLLINDNVTDRLSSVFVFSDVCIDVHNVRQNEKQIF